MSPKKLKERQEVSFYFLPSFLTNSFKSTQIIRVNNAHKSSTISYALLNRPLLATYEKMSKKMMWMPATGPNWLNIIGSLFEFNF